jgi:hypothetical protein
MEKYKLQMPNDKCESEYSNEYLGFGAWDLGFHIVRSLKDSGNR